MKLPFRCRSTSILTIHFKRQLSSHSSRLASSLPPRRLGESGNRRMTLSFCNTLLKFSAKSARLDKVKQGHAYAIKLGFCFKLSLQNCVLYGYVKCKEFNDADKSFDEMPVRNVVTWNILICGVVDCSRENKRGICVGFCYFKRMLNEKVGLDCITCNALIRACTELNDVEGGRRLHCLIVKWGFDSDCFAVTALVDFYGKCGFMAEARRVFEEVLFRDLVLWNTIVSCYVVNGLPDEAFDLFKAMCCDGLKGDNFTFSSLLSGSGSETGKQLHGVVIKFSFDFDIPVASSLIDMYAKCGDIDDARKGFDAMVAKNVVSWNSMIAAYGQHGDGNEAMRLLRAMLHENFHPDELTFASIFRSCGRISSIWEIMQVHAFVVKDRFEAYLPIANAMINAYSNCGYIARAFLCFCSIEEPDLVSCTSIIGALAFHGSAEQSVSIFERMLVNNTRPDKIAFLGVLSACSHGGLVREGLKYFNMMISDYNIVPDSEHYTCLIDLLGRAGFLDKAFDILASMPIETSPDALAAFVGACNVHGNGELATWAAKKLVEVQPTKPLNYFLLSNICTSEGRWIEAEIVRRRMKKIRDHKLPGCSLVEIDVGSIVHDMLP